MWRGYSNVGQYDSVLALSDFSFGKSSPSVHIHEITSHYQCAWIIILELKCTKTHSNGSQFRQVYSITPITINHPQTQHENTYRMHQNRTLVIWEKASLVNHSHNSQTLSNTTSGHFSNDHSPNLSDLREGKSIQSLTSQSNTLNHNTRTFIECMITECKWFERRHI